MQKTRSALVGAALTGILMAAAAQADSADSNKAPGTADSSAVKVECHGVNACKGKGECGGPGYSCAGNNACKGKGFISLTKAECVRRHGTFKAN